MGFLDYAWTVSFQKDRMKARILLDPCLDQPVMEPDNFGFTLTFPIPRSLDDNQVYYYGYKFAQDKNEKVKIGRLFRASVLHLTTHTLLPLSEKLFFRQTGEGSIIENFAKALVRDIHVNAYIQAWYPDRLVDFAYANALAFQRIKPTDRILTASTKIMTALLSKVNMGIVKGSLLPEQEKAVNELNAKLSMLKETLMASIAGEQVKLEEVFDEYIRRITKTLEPFGPFLEAPSLPYTEWIGPCSIFTDTQAPSDAEIERVFKKSIEALGGTVFVEGSIDSCWRKEQEIEALQVFDSECHQKMREERILSRLRQYASLTRFKTVVFPDEDYTQYLRARFLLQGGSRRLLDSLRVAQDALDEDPGKELGQLDLTAVIQALASKKPATDVFSRMNISARVLLGPYFSM